MYPKAGPNARRIYKKGKQLVALVSPRPCQRRGPLFVTERGHVHLPWVIRACKEHKRIDARRARFLQHRRATSQRCTGCERVVHQKDPHPIHDRRIAYLRSLVVVMNKPVYYFNRGTSTPHPRMNAVIELNNSLFICFLCIPH